MVVKNLVKLLNDSEVRFPILVPEKVFRILQICHARSMVFDNFYLANSMEGFEIKQSPHIGLYHMGARRWVGQGAVKILLSGWQFDAPCKKIGEHEYKVAFSNHSDFEQLMEYFSAARPRLVITDNYRSKDAPILAREIKHRLGIDAIAMP
jgi:putative mRNA 3-end processing factor